MSDKKSFESSLNELELLIKKLESGEIPLEKSLHLFEKSVKLYNECRGSLEKADKKLAKLTDSLKEEDLTD